MGGTARGPGLGSAAGCVRRKTGRPFPPPGVGRLCVPARRVRGLVLWPDAFVGKRDVRFRRPASASCACVQARRARGLVLWLDAFAGKRGVRFRRPLRPAVRACKRGGSGAWFCGRMRSSGNGTSASAARRRPAVRASAEGPGLGSVAWMRSPGNRASASPPGFGRPRVPARRGRATGGGRAAPRHCLRQHVPCAPRHCLRQHVPCAPRHCPRQHVPCAPQHCLRQHVPCAPRPPQASVRTRSRPWSHQPKRAPPCSFFFSKCSVRC